MVMRLPQFFSFAEEIWSTMLARLDPTTEKNNTEKSKMPSMENPVSTGPKPNVPPAIVSQTAEITATTTTMTTTTAPSVTNAGSGTSETKKRCWRRKTVHFTVFLAVFSTILSLLWVYTLTAELRRKAFDENMATDYVLDHISMDNPYLVAYIRDMKLKPSSRQEPLNATQTPEEKFIVNQLQGKPDGIYFEYMSRVGATSTTAWLDSNLNWRGVMVFTDPRSSFDAYRSTRNPKSRILYACLSTDKDTKEITYHQEADVQVTKLGEGPNSLPATRLFCFPLYSILLAYNTTTIDYLSLDSSEIQDGLVLDTIPWEVIRISILSIHWGSHYSDAEKKSIVDKLSRHNYKLVKSLPTGKLVFLYQRLKI